MATIRKGWDGRLRIDGLAQDINKARRDQQFTQEMQGISNNFQRDMASIPGAALRETGATLAVAGGIGYGMIKNKRLRYIMQAVLHFPATFLLLLCGTWVVLALPLMMSDADTNDGALGGALVTGLLVALVGSVAWSVAYIMLRTRKKLEELRAQEVALARQEHLQYAAQQR